MKKSKEIELELDDATFLNIAKQAHKEDITFNKMCNKLLEQYIKELSNEHNK
jgi:hypothetical protein